MTDLLSICISRITVGTLIKSKYVIVPNSKIIIGCISKLYQLGYISGFKILSMGELVVWLKYKDNKSVIRRIVRVSKSGKRIYFRIKDLRKLNGNNFQGFYILSTSYGFLTEQECYFHNQGGEPLVLVI